MCNFLGKCNFIRCIFPLLNSITFGSLVRTHDILLNPFWKYIEFESILCLGFQVDPSGLGLATPLTAHSSLEIDDLEYGYNFELIGWERQYVNMQHCTLWMDPCDYLDCKITLILNNHACNTQCQNSMTFTTSISSWSWLI